MKKLNNDYNPRNPKKLKRKIKFQNLQKNCLIREKILLIVLKKELFRIRVMYLKQKKKNQKKNQKKDQKKKESKKIIECIENESKVIDFDLFKNYVDFLVPSDLAKKII